MADAAAPPPPEQPIMTAADAAAALNAVPVPGNLDTLIAGAQPLGLASDSRPPLPPGSDAAFAGSDAGLPSTKSAGAPTPNATSRPLPTAKDVVRQIKKELNALEEEVPWTAVDVAKWRAARKAWQKRLRAAEAPPEVASCMHELHEALLTDKTTGVFLEGGVWEMALLDCARGNGHHVQLQHCWVEMRQCLQHWLAERALPNGAGFVDRPSYEAGARALRALSAAAARGQEALDQVALDAMLGNPLHMSVLQAMVARELAQTHARLQTLASGAVLPPAIEGALSSSSLNLLAAGSVASDVDADCDGSEATDLSDMDV